MATIIEIAKLAGVSPMTVSNVINKKTNKVSTKTIDKVNEIIKELNYVPNLSARSLASNNSKIIVLVIPQNIEDDPSKDMSLHNPFYGEIINSIERELRSVGYYLMLRFVSDLEDFKDTISNWNADGVIMLGVYEEQIKKELMNLTIPIVLIDSYIDTDDFSIVNNDDFCGGYLATTHLLNHGCKNIGIISSYVGFGGVTDQRVAGYCEALQNNDIVCDNAKMFQINPSYEDGYKLGLEIGENKRGIDGLFVCSDMVALGVIKGLKEKKVAIPNEISIVGFDGLFVGELSEPKLTTIYQDIYQKGITSVHLMMDSIHGKENKKIILPVSLIEKDSVI